MCELTSIIFSLLKKSIFKPSFAINNIFNVLSSLRIFQERKRKNIFLAKTIKTYLSQFILMNNMFIPIHPNEHHQSIKLIDK